LVPLRPHYKQEFHLTGFEGISLRPRYSTNVWGLRGDEPPADWEKSRTIIAVGGSTTECRMLDDSKTWPYLLQQKLRRSDPAVWVGNGGISGQTTRGHTIFVDHVVTKLRPDIVVMLIGANDLWAAMRDQYRQQGSRSDQPVGNLFYRAFTRSRLLQMLYTWKQVLIDKVEVQSFDGTDRMRFAAFTDTRPFEEELEDLEPDIQQYQQRIERLIRLTRSLDAEPVFLTQPLLFEDTPHWRSRDGVPTWIGGVRHRISAAMHWRLLDRFNRALLATCQKEGVACFDLAAAVPHDLNYFYDSVHFNERGADLVAEKVSEFLLSQRLPRRIVAQREPVAR
jgi:lysophospholipase L1-like esterase